MRLLILTQKINQGDPILGFFCNWVKEFSKNFEKITVICLEKGECNLPENVHVFSLGKEKNTKQSFKLLARIKYIFRFYKIIWKERKNYDQVFVHMNQEYVLLGGVFWKLSKKMIGFWYNHTFGTLRTKIAMKFSDIVFHTSPYAFTASTKKSRRMPAGIDIEIFHPFPNKEKQKNSILYIGRIAPVKNVEVLIKALEVLSSKGQKFTLDIYGGYLPEHKSYYEKLKSMSKNLEGMIQFHDAIPNKETPRIYASHKFFVNLTPRGNYDKTVLESLACETLAIVSSEAFKEDIPSNLFFAEKDPQSLSDVLYKISSLSDSEYEKMSSKLSSYVKENHSLSKLSEELKSSMIREI